MTNKRKIFNDPVYGFVNCPSDLIFEIIQHPYFQRLRRIKQLGLTDLVYPGAFHTRFQHAIGSMHLMTQALETLQAKGHLIMDVEKEAAQIAILLHDIGHGPFSHVLEYSILKNVDHEKISELLMQKLNRHFAGALNLAIEMFNGMYHRKFFHQLISSQLDMDRLDYLNRDSFFTGVVEGQIGADRIIKMLNVVDNELVVEEKGLLTVENFLNARRLMYWQVYLHKTALSAETMLKKILERARQLAAENWELNGISDPLLWFITQKIELEDFISNPIHLENFVLIDDIDILSAIKKWQFHEDKILAYLCKSLINRDLFKIKIDKALVFDEKISEIEKKLNQSGINIELQSYLFEVGSISNKAYVDFDDNIKILMKSGIISDVSEASDLPTIKALSNIVKKYYLCYANDVSLQNI